MPVYPNPRNSGGSSLSQDPRDAATRIDQTVSLTGQVTLVKYFMANGDTIEDTLAYGANSTSEPVQVTRGQIVLAPLPTIVLTNFIVASNGTTVNYTVAGGTVTAIVGNITISGSPRSLTHVSSGVASVATPVVNGTLATVNVSSTVPGSVAPVVNGSVTNNSTYVTPTLVLSGWSVAANGTTVNYTATGGTVTALVGSLTVAGVSRTLTHVSSGVASVATAVNSGQVTTVSITSTTPTLATAVTAVSVTNNSTVTVTPTLSGWAVSTNGLQLTYVVSGPPITALTGNLSVAGVSVPFTHVSSGVISVASAIRDNDAVTVTVATSNPALATPVTAVNATNNSTFASPFAKQALTWAGTGGWVVSGDTISQTVVTAYSGDAKQTMATIDINSAAPFEVIGKSYIGGTGFFTIAGLDNDRIAHTGGFNTSTSDMIVGSAVNASGYIELFDNGAFFTNSALTGGAVPPVQFKFSGNGAGSVTHFIKVNGITWTAIRTVTGLTGNLVLRVDSAGNIPANSVLRTDVALYV